MRLVPGSLAPGEERVDRLGVQHVGRRRPATARSRHRQLEDAVPSGISSMLADYVLTTASCPLLRSVDVYRVLRVRRMPQSKDEDF